MSVSGTRRPCNLAKRYASGIESCFVFTLLSCKIWYLIVSEDDAHRGNIDVARLAPSPSSPRLRRAAMRALGLDRSARPSKFRLVPPFPPTMIPVVNLHGCRRTSERSSAGFLSSVEQRALTIFSI